jgi:hypothetical protein
VSEQLPKRLTDDEILKGVLARLEEFGIHAVIDDSIARLIASQYHGGQSSALYSFASTGAIDKANMIGDILECHMAADDDENFDPAALNALYHYVGIHGDREPVKGWHLHAVWDEGDDPIGVKYRNVSDRVLARKIERSKPFESDDAEVELNRRLGRVGLTWMYDRETRSGVVVIPLDEVGDA